MLSWEKSHFMVREGVVLGHIISGKRLELSRARRLLPEIHTRLCQSLQAITTLLFKDKDFIIDEKGKRTFTMLKEALIEAPILQSPNWDLPFKIMCNALDYAMGAVLEQRLDKKPMAIC